jgi:hypothetical protein
MIAMHDARKPPGVLMVDDRTNRLDVQVSLRRENEPSAHDWTLASIFCDELSSFSLDARSDLAVRLGRLIRRARAAPPVNDQELPEDAALVHELARRASHAATRVLAILDALPPEALRAALVLDKWR